MNAAALNKKDLILDYSYEDGVRVPYVLHLRSPKFCAQINPILSVEKIKKYLAESRLPPNAVIGVEWIDAPSSFDDSRVQSEILRFYADEVSVST